MPDRPGAETPLAHRTASFSALILSWCSAVGLFLAPPIARSEEVERFVPEPVHIFDRFETDTHDMYKTAGEVKWSLLKMTIPKDGMLARTGTIEGDFTCELDIWPSAIKPGEQNVSRLGWVFSNGVELAAVVTRENRNGQSLRQLAVFYVSRRGGGAEPAVEQIAISPVFVISGDVEHWSVRYKYGLVELRSDGRLVARAYCDALASWCNAIALTQLSGEVDVSRFELQGRTVGYTEAQRKCYDEGNALRARAEAAKAAGDLKLAVELERQRIPIMEKAFGSDEVGIATVYGWVNDIAADEKRFDAVKRLSERAADQFARCLGPDHPEALLMRVYEAYAMARLGDSDGAERLAREPARNFFRLAGTSGVRARQVAVQFTYILDSQARRRLDAGDYAGSQRYRAEIVEILSATYGADSEYVRVPKLQHHFINEILAAPSDKRRPLAQLQLAMLEQYDKDQEGGNSAPLNELTRLLSESRRLLGDDHPYTVEALVATAIVEMNVGDFGPALIEFEEAAATARKMDGENRRILADAETQLASAYSQLERFDEATPLFRDAMEVYASMNSTRTHAYARFLLEYGRHLTRIGDYKASQEQLTACLQLYRELHAESDPNAIIALERLTNLHRLAGNMAAADALLEQQRQLLRESKDRGIRPTVLREEADALFIKRKVSESIAKHEEALAESARIYGKGSRDYESGLESLLEIYAWQNDSAGVSKTLGELLEFARMKRESLFDAYSVGRQFQQSASDRPWLNRLMALAVNGNMPPATAYEHLLTIKGAATLHQRRVNVAAANPVLRPLFVRRQDNSSEIMAVLGQPMTPENGQRLSQLADERDRIERDMSRQSSEYRAVSERLTIDRLLDLLPDKTVIVDYVAYERPPGWLERVFSTEPRRMFAAFVVSKESGVQLVNLGRPADIDQALLEWCRAIGAEAGNLGPTFNPQLENDTDGAAAKLRQLIWDPLQASIGQADSVLISPDGTLTLCPFAALPMPEGKSYLIEDLALCYVPTVGLVPDLLSKRSEPARATLLLVGDVDYESAGDGPSQTDGDSTPGVSGGLRFSPLPVQTSEAVPVRQCFERRYPQGSVIQLVRDQATERQLRANVLEASFLHLETHGFCLPLSVLLAIQNPGHEVQPLPADPLITGVALAGANRPAHADGASDGLLWADEISTLDLGQADLVTLSACETAVGSVVAGEGMQGSQRALFVAGARSSLTSLWSVEIKATRSVMEHFYQSTWTDRRAKSEALRRAMIYMLREYPWSAAASTGAKRHRCPPLLWASWVLYGDWR